ncbi:hypothetical protein HGP29_28015 [Flammeovirga sp. SR4]|uniref:Uncharacterized protein n=2 Tax=Flammeovirga agarivorans TaxID=2726742 RepID=A0A7X8SRR9_9BACT|nr:hypothetical protein [Flammeovirga agarivorans]
MEEIYGINKEFAHPRAIELVPEEFFWSNYDELAPFGSDEGDMALAEYRDWRKDNPNSSIMECLIWTIESVGEMKFQNYNKQLLMESTLLKQIEDPTFDEQQYIFTLDISVIGTGFGQLVDEGEIEKEAKPTISIAINRLIKWSELHSDGEHSKQFIENLQILNRILREA